MNKQTSTCESLVCAFLKTVLIFSVFFSCRLSIAQVAINSNGLPPDTSAMLDIQSTKSGILIPRLSTAGRDSIVNPAEGLLIYNVNLKKFEHYSGGIWRTIISSSSSSGSSAEGSGYCSEGVRDYDSNYYETIKIGSQCWMAENLKSKHYADGSSITEKYTYDDSIHNARVFGFLYSWNAAMNGSPSSNSNPSGVQGACPNGWHLPSEDEWKVLEYTLGMSPVEYNTTGDRGSHGEGDKLKATNDTHFWSYDLGGNNYSGFTALPGGMKTDNLGYISKYDAAQFWTSTEYNTNLVYIRGVDGGSDKILRNYTLKTGFALSVRCIRNP